ncbi:MAG TPA: CopG family transcriptional regulator [Anaerolineae bacterium]|nr:CopG family transcriptional regulator [Anaerolineae bacterium]
MEKQNVTLSLPKETLRKAKVLAIKRNMSLSALLTQTVEAIVAHADEYERAKEEYLDRLERGADLGTKGTITWTRDELHER